VWSADATRDVAVISGTGTVPGTRTGTRAAALVSVATLPADAESYGHAIFAALHDADAASLDVLVIERVPDDPAWWAVADRLRRAAQE
jgi:L-threonylcarbamoyladenylate synthase